LCVYDRETETERQTEREMITILFVWCLPTLLLTVCGAVAPGEDVCDAS
jgi:hypothetical protein